MGTERLPLHPAEWIAMTPKMTLALCLSASILAGLASGFVTGELHAGPRGVRGVRGAAGPVGATGAAGKAGSAASVGPLGVCVDVQFNGTNSFVDSVAQPVTINGVPSCETGTFVSIQPSKQDQ